MRRLMIDPPSSLPECDLEQATPLPRPLRGWSTTLCTFCPIGILGPSDHIGISANGLLPRPHHDSINRKLRHENNMTRSAARSNGVSSAALIKGAHYPKISTVVMVEARCKELPTRKCRGRSTLPLKALPVALPNTRMPIGIMTLKNRMLTPLAQLFIENIRAVAKPMGLSQ